MNGLEDGDSRIEMLRAFGRSQDSRQENGLQVDGVVVMGGGWRGRGW